MNKSFISCSAFTSSLNSPPRPQVTTAIHTASPLHPSPHPLLFNWPPCSAQRFLEDLEERVDEGPVITDICDIIHQHALHSFPVYVDYVRNQAYQEKIYTSLL